MRGWGAPSGIRGQQMWWQRSVRRRKMKSPSSEPARFSSLTSTPAKTRQGYAVTRAPSILEPKFWALETRTLNQPYDYKAKRQAILKPLHSTNMKGSPRTSVTVRMSWPNRLPKGTRALNPQTSTC